MKRLMFGILVALGLIGLANAGDRLFSGEDLERYEDLKKRWEVVKNATAEEDQFFIRDIARYMEMLEYADKLSGEIGTYEAKKATAKKYEVGFRFADNFIFKRYEDEIELAEGELEEKGLLKRYNEFKAEMAKCRLSGKKCVEE